MRAAREAVEQARASLRLEQANAKPDPDVQVGYKRTAVPGAFSVQAIAVDTLFGSVTIPLPIRNRNQGQIAAAVSGITAAESSLASTEALVRSDLATAQKDYESRKRLLDETLRAMRDRAQEVYKISDAAYREGSTDILRLLDAERARIDPQMLYIRTLTDSAQCGCLANRGRNLAMKRLLFIVIISIVFWSCQSESNSQSQPAPPPTGSKRSAAQSAKPEAGLITLDETEEKSAHIVVEQIQPKNVTQSISAPGQLVVNEDRTWRVGAIAAGKIDDLFVKVGDSARAGQILARIHSHDVHEARAAYRKAIVELNRARYATAYATQHRDRAKRLLELRAGSRQDLELADSELVNAQA